MASYKVPALAREISLYLLIGPKLACAAFSLGAVVECLNRMLRRIVLLPCSIGAVMLLCRVGQILLVVYHLHVSAVVDTLHTMLTKREMGSQQEGQPTSKVRDSTDGEVAGGGRYRRRQALERQIGCFSVL
jgi:hypothetical protein